MASKKRKWRAGDILEVPLSGSFGYGIVARRGEVAFFSRRWASRPSASEILGTSIAFRLLVVDDPVLSGTWPLVTQVDLPPELREAATYWIDIAGDDNNVELETSDGDVRVVPKAEGARFERGNINFREEVEERLAELEEVS